MIYDVHSELGREALREATEAVRYSFDADDSDDLFAYCCRAVTRDKLMEGIPLSAVSTAQMILDRMRLVPRPIRLRLVSVITRLLHKKECRDLRSLWAVDSTMMGHIELRLVAGVNKVRHPHSFDIGAVLLVPPKHRIRHCPLLSDGRDRRQRFWRNVVLLVVPSSQWEVAFGDLVEVRQRMRNEGTSAVLVEAVTLIELFEWAWRRPLLIRFGGLTGFAVLVFLIKQCAA